MTTKKPPVPVALLMLVGIIAISFSAIFIKWSSAPASVQAMYRLLFTSLLMAPFVRPYSGALAKLRLNDWLLLAASGFMLALHFYCGWVRLNSLRSPVLR